jgi:hypothetical protein
MSDGVREDYEGLMRAESSARIKMSVMYTYSSGYNGLGCHLDLNGSVHSDERVFVALMSCLSM